MTHYSVDCLGRSVMLVLSNMPRGRAARDRDNGCMRLITYIAVEMHTLLLHRVCVCSVINIAIA